MPSFLDRKKFLSLSLAGATGLIIGKPLITNAQQQKPDPLDKELVKEFVGVSHRDVNRVKELLEKTPGLLNCSWDWGGGDFESGLEAAGHVGNKDIANYLLSKGARMNLFCAAMLGKLDIVKATLDSYPDLKLSKGPHGLQLLHHATKGGDDAKAVLSYLQQINAA